MFITNDVSLLTFVPLGLLLSDLTGMDASLCRTVTLMTIAANSGSMLTPIGNPQNLYLYSVSGISLGGVPGGDAALYRPLRRAAGGQCVFVLSGAPIAAGDTGGGDGAPGPAETAGVAGAVLRCVCWEGAGRAAGGGDAGGDPGGGAGGEPETAAAGGLQPAGNLHMPLCLHRQHEALSAFHNLVAQLLEGHVRLASVGISQIISNVPAALLLSGFTDAWGRICWWAPTSAALGTLIASMASLISYKQMARRSRKYPGGGIWGSSRCGT